MGRIAVGGLQHETNTFAPVPATLTAFEQADGWPGLTAGADLFTVFSGINVAIAGFLDAARETGRHQLIPTVWASATPSAQVTDEAFETIAGRIVDGIRRAGPLDGIYLDLHGAMVTRSYDDGEGELLARVREVAGKAVPLVVSLDLHANVTREMVSAADVMVACREYPHVDMALTGQRCWQLLEALARGAPKPAKAFRQVPFLIPLTAQCTYVTPAKDIAAAVRAAEGGAIASASFAPGFPPADIFDCGPSVLVYALDEGRAATAADALLIRIVAVESRFGTEFLSPDEAITAALAIRGDGPVILADTQDNPGAGGNADTVGLLEALLRRDVPRSAFGVFYDPQVADRAHEAGLGAAMEVAIGAKSGFPGEEPLQARFEVAGLGDGCFRAEGDYFGGAEVQLGRMAHLRKSNVSVVVASRKEQAADRAMFQHVGVEPAAINLLALKSSVHYRADLEPLSRALLVVVSPGPNVADPSRLQYRKLRPEIRRKPRRFRRGCSG